MSSVSVYRADGSLVLRREFATSELAAAFWCAVMLGESAWLCEGPH